MLSRSAGKFPKPTVIVEKRFNVRVFYSDGETGNFANVVVVRLNDWLVSLRFQDGSYQIVNLKRTYGYKAEPIAD